MVSLSSHDRNHRAEQGAAEPTAERGGCALTFGPKMNSVTITQNRANWWTATGAVMAAVLLIASLIGMGLALPFEVNFVWLLLMIIFVGSLVLGGNYAYWMISPREAVFSISDTFISVEDQPVLGWLKRSFVPSDVVEIVYNSETGSFLKTQDGEIHLLSDILMMKRREIFAAISEIHPHITLTHRN